MKTTKRVGGRPRSRATILGSKIVRRMLDPEVGISWQMIWAVLGPEAAAEACIRRHKATCKRLGLPYDRKKAVKTAAKFFSLDDRTLENWMRRSKQPRQP